jgi:hypothetical protein
MPGYKQLIQDGSDPGYACIFKDYGEFLESAI